ncbi:MAG: PAS domain-containing protein [Rhodospirillaceae bacterium]
MSSAGTATPPAPSARIRQEFAWLIGASLAGLAAIALVLCAVQYHRERVTTLRVLEASTAERAALLDGLLAAAAAPVTALRTAAEAAGRAPAAADLARLLSLLPALSALDFRPETAGEAAAPPPHRPRWSPVYHDQGEGRLRVGYTEPVLREGRVLGVIAAEIGLGFLHRAVDMPDYSGQRLVLADRSRHVVADSRVGPAQGKTPSLALGEVLPPALVPDEAFGTDPAAASLQFASPGYTVLAAPLTAAPWVLVCLVPEGALFLRVVPWLSMTLALVVVVFVVLTGAHFYMSRRFIQPALTLVRLVAAESSGDVLPPQRLPALWQPLVGRVAGAFSAIRIQLARALGDAEHLCRLMGQQTEDLTRTGAALAQETSQRRMLDSLLAGAPAALMVLDRESRILIFNRYCEAVSGISAAQALGRRPWEFLVPPDQADLARVQIATALRDDGPIRGELSWLSPGGPPRRLLWSLTALAGETGETAFVVAIGTEPPDPV